MELNDAQNTDEVQNPDDIAALALATGLKVVEAARQAGMSKSTLHRRLHDPEFRRRVSELRSDIVASATGKLADISSEAAATLQELLSDAYLPSIRLGAARSVLEFALKAHEAMDLARRIEELEQTAVGGGLERRLARA